MIAPPLFCLEAREADERRVVGLVFSKGAAIHKLTARSLSPCTSDAASARPVSTLCPSFSSAPRGL